MSLIDSLIDELNKSADEWNESNMFELARMCRNAAYTILETRNDAELLRRMWKQARLEAQGFKAENAKLRSICAEVAGILFNLDVDYCGLCDRDSINHPCPVHTVKGGECLIESELRELGVGVDA